MDSFEYTSLHQYLDCVLQNNPNTTHAQVKEAKQAYWKLYYSYYRKQKRKNRKEFTLGFYQDQLEEIHRKRGELTISKFLYEAIDKELKSDSKGSVDRDDIANIHLQLMQLINLVEELIEDEVSNTLITILESLEAFEDSFSQKITS